MCRSEDNREYSEGDKLNVESDFWDRLSDEDRVAINEGLHQLDNGQYVSAEDLRKEISRRFGFYSNT